MNAVEYPVCVCVRNVLHSCKKRPLSLPTYATVLDSDVSRGLGELNAEGDGAVDRSIGRCTSGFTRSLTHPTTWVAAHCVSCSYSCTYEYGTSCNCLQQIDVGSHPQNSSSWEDASTFLSRSRNRFLPGTVCRRLALASSSLLSSRVHMA